MELTSEALKIIAETEIKGDVIVGGVIKSSNYVANSTGMKLSLATGEWDSKYFKVSSTGTITATGGTIGGWNIEDGIASTSSDNLMAVTIRPINVSGIPWLYVGKRRRLPIRHGVIRFSCFQMAVQSVTVSQLTGREKV